MDKLQTPPIRTPLTEPNGAAAPATDKQWYYYWQRSAGTINALEDAVAKLQKEIGNIVEPPVEPPPGTAPDAPNVTATTPTITYQYWAHETVPVFSGTISYPTADSDYALHFQRVDVEFLDPITRAAIYLNSYGKPVSGSDGPYTGWQEEIRQTKDDRPNCKLRFTSYNEDGRPTLPPYETATFTIPGYAIISLAASDDTASRWKDQSQAIHAVVPVTIDLNTYPHYCTVWTKSPQYGLIWHGWPSVEAADTPVRIGDKGTSTIIYPPTGIGVASETVTVYAAIGIYDSWVDPSDPVQAAGIPTLTSTTVDVSAPTAPGSTDAHGAWIEPLRYYSTVAGAHNWGWPALHCVVDTIDDANFWFIRVHMQSGQYVSGVWTPGGQFGGSENGWPGVGIGDWDTADDHSSWIERVAGTKELIVRDNGGWPVPSDNNLTYVIYATITSRRNGPDGATVQQYCWSSAVGVSSPPWTYGHQDVTVDESMGNPTPPGEVGAAVTALAAVEIGPRYADRSLGQHTVIRLTPTLDDPALGNDVTFWVQFGDGKWVRQGVWRINDTITDVTLGEQTLGTEGLSGAGNIWVPTSAHRRTWVAAARETNVETDDPPSGAPTATFDVPPVGSCPPDDITDIHFVVNPDTGDEMVYVMKDTWKWFYFELDMTQPTYEKDNNYWFAFITVETGYTDGGGVWHSAPDQGVTDDHAASLYLGRKHNDTGELQGGHPVYGSTVQFKGGDPSDYWDEPPLETLEDPPQPYPYWTVRFRVYAVSRLGTDSDGGPGTMTLQTGWPGGADHYDLTPDIAKMPAPLNLKNVNPVTSFDPDSFFTGGAGNPLGAAIADPLRVFDNALTLIPESIDKDWLANGAVIASKTALDAISNATGMLKANSVVCGLVNLPVSQLIAGSAIFTGDVYLSKGDTQPAIAMNNLGIWLFGAANAFVGTPPVNVPDTPGVPGHCSPQTNNVSGLTSQPWTNITNSKILLYGGDSGGTTGPSTLIQGSGITLFAKNGDITASPYFALQPTGMSLIAPKTFGVSLTPGQLVFTYDSAGTTWGTPTGASPRILLTNTLDANGMKVLYQQIPPLSPPNDLMPSFIIRSNLVQQWTKDGDSNYPCIGFQGNQMNLTYGPFTTLFTSSMIQLQYLSGGLLSLVRLTTASLMIQQTASGASSTVTVNGNSLVLGQTGNSSSVTLNNSGQAIFTAGGTTTTISGKFLNTGVLTADSGCQLCKTDPFALCEIGVQNQSDPALSIKGISRSSAGSFAEYLTIQFNGQPRKIQLFNY